MYFNTNCSGDGKSFNIGSCSICFNDVDLAADNQPHNSHKLFETCSKYLHSAITTATELTLRNTDAEVSNFCSHCLESADQLADLTDKLEVFQKNVSEYILLFSLEVFQRRANPYKNNANIDSYDKKLVLCNLSGLQDHKAAENDISFQPPPISVETESSNVEETARNPLITSEEQTTDNSIFNSVTFERIIKTESLENEIPREGHEDKQGFGEKGVIILAGNAAKLQSLTTNSPSSSKKFVLGKLNPFVKLERLTYPCLKDVTVKIPAEQRNNKVLITNSAFNIVIEQRVRDMPTLCSGISIHSDKSSLAKYKSAFRSIYRKKTNIEIDPDFVINKNNSYRPVMRKRRNYSVNPNCKTATGFECSVCHKQFSTKGNLDSHYRLHTGEKPFNCPRCNRAFRHYSNMYVHRKRCGSDTLRKHNRPSTTTVDPITFESMTDTAATEGRKNVFACSVCHKEFSTKHSLVTHFRIHTGEKPFNCLRCNKAFRQLGHLIRHKKRCGSDTLRNCNVSSGSVDPIILEPMVNPKTTDEVKSAKKIFGCSACSKLFSSKQYLISHFRIHTGEKPFKCSVCQKVFRYHSNYYTHMKSHPKISKVKHFVPKIPTCLETQREPTTTGPPFQCSVCSKMFSLKGNLNVHFRMHTGEKPYKCASCHKSFTYKGSLGAHSCKLEENINELDEVEIEYLTEDVEADPLCV